MPFDALVVAGACLTQRWTVPADALATNQGWVLALASITVVACQWHTDGWRGAGVVVAVDAAYLGGVLLAAPERLAGPLEMVVWLPVEAVLGRLLWRLVRRGGQRADELAARAEATRRAEAVAEAVRADERAHAATLHDTAASTLLMVGLGQVGPADTWLRDQARRDLDSLGEWSTPPGRDQDVVPGLREVIQASRVAVTPELPAELTVPARVAAALCGAVGEALTNVGRHAGVSTATVTAGVVAGRVVVEVADQGRGFTPDEVSAGHYGVSRSIRARMAGVGGRAELTSAPGRGTTVRLAWPGETA